MGHQKINCHNCHLSLKANNYSSKKQIYNEIRYQ